jgi:hypothetical protein
VTWTIPSLYGLLLLAAAAFRTWRILAEDTILDRPRAAFVRKFPKGEEWLLCPWCAGAWISTGWWLAWVWSHHWTLVVATPFAISSVVGLIAANIDPD